MSQIVATVVNIDNVENLNIVTFDCQGTTLEMMSLELDSSIKVDKSVLLGYKFTSVVIAKEFDGFISLSNKMLCKVEAIEQGKLLSSVRLSFHEFILESLLTTSSCIEMDLKTGDRVSAFIQASEISILKLLDV